MRKASGPHAEGQTGAGCVCSANLEDLASEAGPCKLWNGCRHRKAGGSSGLRWHHGGHSAAVVSVTGTLISMREASRIVLVFRNPWFTPCTESFTAHITNSCSGVVLACASVTRPASKRNVTANRTKQACPSHHTGDHKWRIFEAHAISKGRRHFLGGQGHRMARFELASCFCDYFAADAHAFRRCAS